MDSLGFQHCSLTLWPWAGYSVSLILYHIGNRGLSSFFPYKTAVRIKQGDRIRCWTGLGAEKLDSFPFEPLYTSLLFSTSLCAGFCWDLVTWEPQDGRRGKERNMFSSPHLRGSSLGCRGPLTGGLKAEMRWLCLPWVAAPLLPRDFLHTLHGTVNSPFVSLSSDYPAGLHHGIKQLSVAAVIYFGV